MPPVVIGIAAAGMAVASAALSGTAAILLAIGSVVLTAASTLLQKKPKTPDISTGIQQTVREAAAPWTVIYGEQLVGGVIVYIDSDGVNNKWLDIVIVWAGHRIRSIKGVYFDQDLVHFDKWGNALGKYAGYAWCAHRLGGDNQSAIQQLIDNSDGKWTDQHRLRGKAHSYFRLKWDQDGLYGNGVPQIRALIEGKDDVYDPRDAQTKYTDNFALCCADYLNNERFGLNCAYGSDIDNTALVAAANVSDEIVDVVNRSTTFEAGVSMTFKGFPTNVVTYVETQWKEGTGNDRVTYVTYEKVTQNVADCILVDSDVLKLKRGDRVRFVGGSLPAPLAQNTDYYWIPVANVHLVNDNRKYEQVGKLASSEANADAGNAINLTTTGSGQIQRVTFLDLESKALAVARTGDRMVVSSTGTLPAPLAPATGYYWIRVDDTHGRLAASQADAFDGNAISVTTLGTGTHTITRTHERRYVLSGAFKTDAKPKDIIQQLLSAGAGKAIYTGGVWRILAGVYQTPTVTLTESDLRAALRVQPRVSRREGFNAVKGTFNSPADRYQEADFPRVTNSTYLSEDGGERIWKDIQLKFTPSASLAQRLAKIELERARQQITVFWPGKLTCYRVQPGDTVYLTIARYGWSAKPFEVVEATLSVEGEENPVIGVDLVLRETASTVFDWDLGKETKFDPAPDTLLPDPFTVGIPGSLNVVEEMYETRDGGGVKVRAIMSWTAPDDEAINRYRAEYRLSGSTTWLPVAETITTQTTIEDIAPGTWEFRVKAINDLGVAGDWVQVSREIFGLLPAPVDVTNFALSAIAGGAVFSWDRHPDLDVRVGGQFELRHTPSFGGGVDWKNCVKITSFPGDAANGVAPLLAGSYLIKAIDSSGSYSVNAVKIETTAPDALNFNSVATTIEEPDFGGVKTNMVAVDNGLKLAGLGLWDSITDFDAVEDVDSYGGLATSGSYEFQDVIDTGAVYASCRITAEINVLGINTSFTVDTRPGNVDDWDDWDAVSADSISAQIFIATTDDDPGGSPTWSAWQPFVIGDYAGRAFKFKIEVATTDADQNVLITRLRATVDMPDRLESGVNVASSASGTIRISFAQAFRVTPAIGVTAKNLATGDYMERANEDHTGFDVGFKNSGGSYVVRNFDWLAKGDGARA